MTDLAPHSTPSRRSGGVLAGLTLASAFAVYGFSGDLRVMVAMTLIGLGSLVIGAATPSLDDRATLRSLRLLQVLGFVCCITVIASLR